MATLRAARSRFLSLTLACAALTALAACPSAQADSVDPGAVLPPPVAAGTSAANIALSGADRQVMLRWVARRTGTLSTLHMRIEAGGSACRLDSSPGYGLGNGGTWHVTTHPVLPDGRPDTSATLSTQDIRPCSDPAADVRAGVIKLAMNLPVVKGDEYATVVRNSDPAPTANYSSTNFLYTRTGLSGANGRNERDPNASDVYYGLDPRELVGFSRDGGQTWALPGTSANTADRGYLATYIQQFADGKLTGQPYYYSTPATTTKTMVYPNVPVQWNITALGAYTPTAGSGTLTLYVDGVQRARAAVSGSGMIRASIPTVTVEPGQDVKVVDEGLSIHGIVADGAWGNLLGMQLTSKPWYLLGEGSYSTAAPLYPLPWYGADPQGASGAPTTDPATPPASPAPTSPSTTKPTKKKSTRTLAQLRKKKCKAAKRRSRRYRTAKRRKQIVRAACSRRRS